MGRVLITDFRRCILIGPPQWSSIVCLRNKKGSSFMTRGLHLAARTLPRSRRSKMRGNRGPSDNHVAQSQPTGGSEAVAVLATVYLEPLTAPAEWLSPRSYKPSTCLKSPIDWSSLRCSTSLLISPPRNPEHQRSTRQNLRSQGQPHETYKRHFGVEPRPCYERKWWVVFPWVGRACCWPLVSARKSSNAQPGTVPVWQSARTAHP